MDKRDIIELATGLWLLVERFMTVRKNRLIKENIDTQVDVIKAHVPGLDAAFERARKQTGTPGAPVSIEYSAHGPKRKK